MSSTNYTAWTKGSTCIASTIERALAGICFPMQPLTWRSSLPMPGRVVKVTDDQDRVVLWIQEIIWQ